MRKVFFASGFIVAMASFASGQCKYYRDVVKPESNEIKKITEPELVAKYVIEKYNLALANINGKHFLHLHLMATGYKDCLPQGHEIKFFLANGKAVTLNSMDYACQNQVGGFTGGMEIYFYPEYPINEESLQQLSESAISAIEFYWPKQNKQIKKILVPDYFIKTIQCVKE